ncbi:MAG TPA: hypothetical protein VHK63_00965 [Candidatus Limnocylindria bacterium]|nr:hypothetical protein [Candidatus Limnocylindria bacterium]
MTRSRLAAVAGAMLALTAASCGGTQQSPSAAPFSIAATATMTPAATDHATPGPTSAVRLAHPGRPYTGAAILAAMRGSTRPGGVPADLETRAVAAAVAERVWSWDGQPWERISAGGACGPSTCTLELAGAPAGGAGADLYLFEVDPGSGRVTSEATDLHGHPGELERQLDALARDLLPQGRLEGMALASARWLPPPDTDRYWLAYRSGGEEGARAVDVLLDAAAGEIVEVRDG